jgi:hypothetical protein
MAALVDQSKGIDGRDIAMGDDGCPNQSGAPAGFRST